MPTAATRPRFHISPGYRDGPRRLGIDDDGSPLEPIKAPTLDAFYVDGRPVTFEEYAGLYHAATGATVTRDADGTLTETWPCG